MIPATCVPCAPASTFKDNTAPVGVEGRRRGEGGSVREGESRGRGEVREGESRGKEEDK